MNKENDKIEKEKDNNIRNKNKQTDLKMIPFIKALVILETNKLQAVKHLNNKNHQSHKKQFMRNKDLNKKLKKRKLIS